jgi:hypothetical protein
MPALLDAGYQPVEGKVAIRGFGGIKTEVDLMFTTNQGYDIGFKKTGDAFELVADWYDIKDINPEKLLSQVQQRYAYHAVKNRMESQGFEVVEDVNEKDKTIHLTVRRTVF